MKKKIIIIILLGVIGTFFIYNENKQEKIYFLSLGDGLASGMTAYHIEGYNYNDYLRDELEQQSKLEKYIPEFSEEDQSVENLITRIENNYKSEELNLTIQQALSKSKIITIGIGLDELANTSIYHRLLSREKEDYKKDMTKLIQLIRSFNEGKIFLLGIYKAYNLNMEDVDEINRFLKELAENNKIIYVDIANLSENADYFLLNNSYYLNYKGHKEIFNRIIQK